MLCARTRVGFAERAARRGSTRSVRSMLLAMPISTRRLPGSCARAHTWSGSQRLRAELLTAAWPRQRLARPDQEHNPTRDHHRSPDR